jgi:hypothetical protein
LRESQTPRAAGFAFRIRHITRALRRVAHVQINSWGALAEWRLRWQVCLLPEN